MGKNKKAAYSKREEEKANRIGREDIEYMTLLGQEILQVLDNIKISTGENIKNKHQDRSLDRLSIFDDLIF